jgi:hypothetical protein
VLEVGTVSLAEAREFVKNGRKKGVHCPCCRQFAKEYHRQIHSSMAKCLIRLYWLDKKANEYYHVKDITKDDDQRGDFSKLSYWGLIEEMPKDPADINKRTSGYWTITKKGRLYCECQITVPQYIVLYDSDLLRFEGKMVTILTGRKKSFNYEELMNNG